VSRLPLRARVTLIFATAMALVLAGTGFVLYDRLATSLDRTLDQSLRARASDVAALVRQADTGLRGSSGASGNGFAQVLDARGRVFDATPGAGSTPLLDPAQLSLARRKALLVPRGRHAGGDVRLLAESVTAQDQRLVVVVGAPLGLRDQAVADLRSELLVGGPIALLLASLLGYLVAAAALRPVERMRVRANAISDRDLAERLPVPPARDEIGRLGETLNAMLGRIEHGVRRERELLADASHELRMPLALLRAEVELALEAPREKDELLTALRSVGQEADRLSQLAEDLLLLNRIDEGLLPIRWEDVDLDELLDGVATRFARRAGETGRRIESDGGGLRASVDRIRLEQALANLVENALRYGGGTVRLAGVERGAQLEIHVTDEGDGLPAGFASRAFERFSRADEARGAGGAGLGLAIVKAVAEAHGGTAGAFDRPGGGAEVWLSVALLEEVHGAGGHEQDAERRDARLGQHQQLGAPG
jgi:signal transduction histidine kinase